MSGAALGDGGYGSGGRAWEALEARQRDLVEALESDWSRRLEKAPAEQTPKCQRCGVRGHPSTAPRRASLRSCGPSVTSWACAIRALETPHCPSCGSTTPCPPHNSLACARDVARRRFLGRVTMMPCMCCGRHLASDAIVCVQCGTTSPRGGFLVQPQLQRCARCGALVASDAGLCTSCGTANFRPAGLFSAGPSDLRLVGCPECGREIAADALLCVHCGTAWPQVVEGSSGVADSSDSESSPATGVQPRHWVAAAEAVDASQRAAAETPPSRAPEADDASRDSTDFFGGARHPLRVIAKQCAEVVSEPASPRRSSAWDGFFDEDCDDGRGVGLARPAG